MPNSKYQDYIDRVLAEAPPFTSDQITKLRGLLAPKPEFPKYATAAPEPVKPKPKVIRCVMCQMPNPVHVYGYVQHDMVWPPK